MLQFNKRTSFYASSNISPLEKYNKLHSNLDQKHKNSPSQDQQNEKRKSESILSRIKKRSFSLSKLQSVRQSQIARQINSQKETVQTKNESQTEQKIIFQKLNINALESLKQGALSHRQRIKRSRVHQHQSSSAQQQLSLLKHILKKKQSDLIIKKQKQKQKQEQTQNLQQNVMATSNSAVKRIKMLKKTKQYQFYDNIVQNLLNKVNRGKQQISPYEQNFVISAKAFVKSHSLSNFKLKQDRQKFRNTYSNNFSPTKVVNALAATINPSPGNNGLFQKKKDSMIFRLSDLTSDNVYEKKITTFIQFLYKVNFSNSIYIDLSLSSGSAKNQPKKLFKVFIGRGNNSQLIKSVVRRRFWLEITTNKSESNFVWTQDTQKQIHTKQLLQDKVSQQRKQQQQQNKRTNVSLKNKFTIASYGQQSNNKILHKKQIQQADVAYSRSYHGLKSPFPHVTIQSITNHIPNNSIIGSKKTLFKLMHWYYSQILKIDPFIYLPFTYHMIPGEKDNPSIKKFKQQQLKYKDRIWIVKPGQNTNRGNGITVATTNQIQKLMKYKKFHKNGEPKTFIIQKYIKPFLYNNRKFDIRHYMLITSVNGILKGYWYKYGYIRTSSQKFDLQQLDNQFIHLTNDAIQKHSQNYGKYEEGNKLSYTTFQRYLDNTVPHKKYDFEKHILQQMKNITTDVLRAGFMYLDPQRNQRLSKGKACNFQLYGMDFMIDHKFRPYLIQINANPCLQISCPLLQRLIPIAIEHTFRLALDPQMPPNDHYTPSKRYQLSDKILDRLKFQLIFDQKNEGKQIRKKCRQCENKFQLNGVSLEPEEDLFEDDGQQIKDDKLFQQGNQ